MASGVEPIPQIEAFIFKKHFSLCYVCFTKIYPLALSIGSGVEPITPIEAFIFKKHFSLCYVCFTKIYPLASSIPSFTANMK